ncbi:MAG: EscU/YscU/HrcU family type III secretion system export apparatus switch protein [Oligoflexia bacterium]|nr:EscU/YscU/HrcU family type III secretion system export apparatus switch protein [Oligoflexia bacterium]
MERTEWPSEQRLNDLREQGQVALSLRLVRVSAFVAFFGTLALLRQDLQMLVLKWWSSQLDLTIGVSQFGQYFLRVLVAPVAAALVAATLVGFLQTRFLFRFGLLGFDANRLSWDLSLTRAAGAICVGVFGTLAVMAALFLAARLELSHFLTLLKSNISGIAPLALEYASRFGLGAALLLFVIACLDVLVQRRVFQLRHRMTRDELAQEVDEMKVRG